MRSISAMQPIRRYLSTATISDPKREWSGLECGGREGELRVRCVGL